VIGWPTTGLGVIPVMVVALEAAPTLTAVGLEVSEESKFPSPGKEAVKECRPAVSAVTAQEPVAVPSEPDNTASQCCVPSETVTEPEGAATPGPVDSPATCTSTVIGWPTTGLGVIPVMVVALEASPTVTPVALEVSEESKFPSPG